MARELHIDTKDGAPVIIRPLERGDEPALRAAIDSFSNRSRYLRFFSEISPVPEPIIHRLADVDHKAHLAWVALDASQPDLPVIGAVHGIRERSGQPVGEFAIGLVDAWQGRGLARLLVAVLCAEARGSGMSAMRADVLWENKAGRALMKALGATSEGSDHQVIQYRFETDATVKRLRQSLKGASASRLFEAVETGRLSGAAA